LQFNCAYNYVGDENMGKDKKYKKKEQKKLKSLIISTNNIVDNLNLIYAKLEQLQEGLNREKK
jgi:hypothetical protein